MTRIATIKTLACTALAVLALATTAWAYLSSTGAGSAAGSASVERTVTITAGTGSNATLLPTGERTGTVILEVANSTGHSLKVNAFELVGPGTAGYSQKAIDCGIDFAKQTNGGQGWTIEPGSEQVELSNAVSMNKSAPNSCQGDSFALYLKTA